MSNQPPNNIVQLIKKLRTMADGVEPWISAGNPWAGPTPIEIRGTADELQNHNGSTESAYATYKFNKSVRDLFKSDKAVPLYRTAVQAAYLAMGKQSEALRSIGLEPLEDAGPSKKPKPPEGLDVREESETSVLVDWDPVPNAEHYLVYFGTSLDAMELRGSATKSELIVSGLIPGTKYFFYVTAVNAAGESAPSNFTTRTTL